MKIAILLFAMTMFVGLEMRAEAKPAKSSNNANPMMSGPLEKHGPYRPGGGLKPCFDKKGISFCQKAQDKGKCPLKKMKKRCKKTCGYCEDQSECQDFGFNCYMATPFTCAQYWFANACKRSCNKCPIVTTTIIETLPTVDPEKECIDTSFNCHLASPYRCALYGFQLGCRKSCGICTPKTTTTITAPTEATSEKEKITTEEDCQNTRDDCDTFFEWYCYVPLILEQCPRFCGSCGEKESTTAEITSGGGTVNVTSFIVTTEGIRTTANATTPATTTTTTTTERTVPTTTTTTEAPEIKPTEPETNSTESRTEATICVDTDPKNCVAWKELGLCFHPAFEKDMKITCPLSCDACLQ